MAVLTIYADASYCPHTGAGGGAYVIKYKDYIITDRFAIRDADDSWESEVMAYGQALMGIRKDAKLVKLLAGKLRVAAILDCEGVGNFMNHDRNQSVKGKEFRPCTLSVREMHNALATYFGVRTTFIHVKSHTDADTIAAYWNNWVDKAAYGVMVYERKKLTKHKS